MRQVTFIGLKCLDLSCKFIHFAFQSLDLESNIQKNPGNLFFSSTPSFFWLHSNLKELLSLESSQDQFFYNKRARTITPLLGVEELRDEGVVIKGTF